MKRVTLLLAIVFCYFTVFADEWVKIRSDEAKKAKIELVSSDINKSIIKFSLDGFLQKKVNTNKGDFYIITLPRATQLLEQGAPDLPKLTASVIIPDQAAMEVRVLDYKVREFENYNIAPSKGNLTRDIDPSKVPYEFGAIYKQNAYFPTKEAFLRDPYIIRDFRGQTVVVQPFRYNPVSKTLQVYYDITVEISRTGDNGINPLVRNQSLEKVDSEFRKFYDRHFLNASGSSRYDLVPEYGNMLIISHGPFMDAMQPYVEWRIKAGRPTEIIDVSTIGVNSAAIKSYIANYYNDNGLTFVLLVGDAAQVPSSFSSGDSDNDYTYVVGNDHYPDLFIGRFSAETEDHVETQVTRTLEYEQEPYTENDWSTIGTGIASDQGPGDDGEYDYEHIRNINDDLLAYTYTYCNELFDGNQGGEDEPGNPTPAQVAEDINDGTSIINYTGHGSTTSWSTSGFSSSDVNALTNNDMLPFIWSVACVNGNFVPGDCFAEAWLRAENNDEPSGAIATLMSTINQSWDPPMCGQDEMVDLLVESYPDKIVHTFGALSMHGCMQMNDEYGSGGDEMTDTWTVFGDPSVYVRTDVAEEMTVSYMNPIFLGMDELTVSSDAEGGLVCLSKDGVVMDTEFIEGGEATLEFEALTDLGNLDIVITCYNYIPHIEQIQVVPSNTPYLVYASHTVQDTTYSGNNMIEPGETFYMTVNLNNMGGVMAEDVDAEIFMTDEYATLLDSEEFYGDIAAGQIYGAEDGFCFSVARNTPDQHLIEFTIEATDVNGEVWTDEFTARVNAPVLRVGEMTVDDSEFGNNNGRLDAGETADLIVHNYNDGHSMATASIAYLNTECHYLELENTVDTIGAIGLIGATKAIFTVNVDEEAPSGSWIAEMDYEVISGMYQAEKTFSTRIGLVYDDFESGDFTKFNWMFDGDEDWDITTQYTYEGFYSAISGEIENGQETELKLSLEIMTADSISFMRKVSSESGDKLKFYIGNTLKGEWSGTTQGWKEETYAVGTGVKTFRWIYVKNGSNAGGADCGWLDYVVFPPIMCLTCYAGPDNTICEGDTYQCQGEATDYESVEWTTSGSGSFDDPTILDPLYTPSEEDYNNGSVELTLTVWGDEGESVDDVTRLSFITEPAQVSTPVGPDYVDLASTSSSEYNIEAVDYASSYEWEVSPAEAGNTESISTTAVVEWNPDYLGMAEIRARASNSCGVGEWSEPIEVFIDNTTRIIHHEAGRLLVYPNPAKDQLTIEFVAGKEQAEIMIFNTIGKLVYSGVIDDAQQYIDLSNLEKGLYFIRIDGRNISESGKFIKQ